MGFDDLLHERSLRILPAEQVEDTSQVTQLNIELNEASNIHFSFLHVNPRVHPLKIKKNGEPGVLLRVHFELLILEELLGVVCDLLGDHGFAIGVVRLVEDGFEDVLIREVVVLAVRGAVFEIGELKILGDDPGEGA